MNQHLRGLAGPAECKAAISRGLLIILFLHRVHVRQYELSELDANGGIWQLHAVPCDALPRGAKPSDAKPGRARAGHASGI